jgi:hypothetical protein
MPRAGFRDVSLRLVRQTCDMHDRRGRRLGVHRVFETSGDAVIRRLRRGQPCVVCGTRCLEPAMWPLVDHVGMKHLACSYACWRTTERAVDASAAAIATWRRALAADA